MPKDVLRRDISPAAKLVFAAIAAEMYGRKTVEMTHAEIGACCHIAARHVKRSIKVLVAEGLVEQRRLPAGCVYQYRLIECGGRSNPQQRSRQLSCQILNGFRSTGSIDGPAPLADASTRRHLPIEHSAISVDNVLLTNSLMLAPRQFGGSAHSRS